MNKTILLGNLGKDPELTTTNNGISVCKFSLAVQRKFANAEGNREVDFINIEAWRNLAETCHKYLKKGSKCVIVGRIQTNSYEAQDGSKRYSTVVVADEIEFISTPKDSNNTNETNKKESLRQKLEQASITDYPEGLTPIEDDDSLPF